MKRIYTADFETTSEENDCRVWCWALYDVDKGSFKWGLDINTFFDCVQALPKDSTIYFHNAKFDIEFCYYWLFQNGFRHTTEDLTKGTFSTVINDLNVFYKCDIMFFNGKHITILDSFKIIPLSIKAIPKAFGLEECKGEIDYIKPRPLGYKPTAEELEYIKNDVVIAGKALKFFFEKGLNRMTQAANAFFDFKSGLGAKTFERLFPPLDVLDKDLRKCYKGGFTYANPKYTGQVVGPGLVFDVNSLYPSVMYYYPLPYDNPVFYEGKYEPDPVFNLYIQRICCQFELKPGHIPTIQLKNNRYFMETEYVTSSHGMEIEMVLTNIDLELFLQHYNVYNLDYICGFKFKSTDTIFKPYISKWMEIKEQSTIEGNKGMRTISKLMLNALYGKFGVNPEVRNKIPYYDNDGFVKYETVPGEPRQTIFLPVAAFVTAYARRITITAAQQHFDRFLYADTDSLHLLGWDIPSGLDIDPVKLGAWKLEGKFNRAKYLRAKCYIENMVSDDGTEFLQVACAGLPHSCHNQVNFDNFEPGLTISGKLQQKRVKGGVILKEVDFSIKI